MLQDKLKKNVARITGPLRRIFLAVFTWPQDFARPFASRGFLLRHTPQFKEVGKGFSQGAYM